jgi:two-component system, NtrC family, sensor kinase
MRILFAEDCPTQRLILSTLLLRDGHQVTAVEDGEKAVALAERETFDCLITDWMMPGIDGLEVVRRVRRIPRESHLHAIMVTAREARQDHLEALEAGVDDFIAKPVDNDELRARIRTAERQQRIFEQLRKNLAERFALRESIDRRERSYRDLFVKSPDPAAILDAERRFAEVNDAWCASLGYSADALVGAPFGRFTCDESAEAVEGFLRALDEKGAADDVRLFVRDADGRRREWGAGGVKLPGGEEVPARYLLRGMDLTERRRRDAATAEREKLAGIGSLLKGVTSEIADPLALATSNLGAMQKYVARLFEHGRLLDETAAAAGKRDGETAAAAAAKADQARRRLRIDFVRGDVGSLLSRTRECVERIRNIVSDVRNFTSFTDETSDVDLVAVVRSALNLAASKLKARAEIVLDLAPTPSIKANAARLGQAFVNVLVNAAEAIPDRGFVKVRTWEEDGRAFASVADDGRGIPASRQSRLFEPFFTTKPLGEGAGLGLNITFNIVKAHDGNVRVASQEGKGTTVTFDFPATVVAAAAPAEVAATPTPP